MEDSNLKQFEALDLMNCLIAPLFFANALSLFSADLLSTIYCAVLLIKGYQAGLLLLPAARQQYAHERTRYWLILAERVLRQWFATPLLGRGPRFQNWILTTAAASSKLMFCCKTLVLISGASISWWNAFCLPLDFTSQAILTSVFFAIHFQASVTQVAYPFQMLVQRMPYILVLQQSVEYLLHKALQLLRMPVMLAGRRSTASSPGSLANGTAPVARCSTMTPAPACNAAGAFSTVFADVTESDMIESAVPALGVCANEPSAPAPAASGSGLYFEQPSRAPDVASLQGRFILTMSTAYMLFVVLILPLYVAWNLERHWKSRFLATHAEQQQGHKQRSVVQQQELNSASDDAEEKKLSGPSAAAAGCSMRTCNRSSCSTEGGGGQSKLSDQAGEVALGESCTAAQAAQQLFSSSKGNKSASESPGCGHRRSSSSKLDGHGVCPVPQADGQMCHGTESNSLVAAMPKQLGSSGHQLEHSRKHSIHEDQKASAQVIYALPRGRVLCKQLAILVGVSFGWGQAFVLLLNMFPKLTCLFWQQIIF